MKHFAFDLGNTAQWILGIGLGVWIIEYTMFAPWWRNWLGRSFVGVVIAFIAVLWPSMYQLADPNSHFLGSTGYDYLEIANVTFAALIVIGLIWQFWVVHRRGQDNKAGEDSL